MRILAMEVRPDEEPYFRFVARETGVQVELTPSCLCEETVDMCRGFDGVTILGMRRIDRGLLNRLESLGVRYLSTRTVGYNHIDIDSARQTHIRVSRAGYSPDSVADFTIMLLLLTLRRYKPALYRQNVNDYSLNGLLGKTMRSRTVGIMGTGSIGAAVIRLLSGFGCRILAYNRSVNPQVEKLAQYVSIDELYRESDLISFHLPLTSETRHMINRDTLSGMKDGVVLVNTARGELMDVKALIEGVESRKIGALAMDVFEQEGDIYHVSHINDILINRDMAYLRQFPNVVLTQHMAFYTESAVEEMVRCGVEGIFVMADGKKYRYELV